MKQIQLCFLCFSCRQYSSCRSLCCLQNKWEWLGWFSSWLRIEQTSQLLFCFLLASGAVASSLGLGCVSWLLSFEAGFLAILIVPPITRYFWDECIDRRSQMGWLLCFLHLTIHNRASKWLSGQRHFHASLMTWVWSPELIYWKERNDSSKLLSDLRTYIVACLLQNTCNKWSEIMHTEQIPSTHLSLCVCMCTGVLMCVCVHVGSSGMLLYCSPPYCSFQDKALHWMWSSLFLLD